MPSLEHQAHDEKDHSCEQAKECDGHPYADVVDNGDDRVHGA